MRPLIVSLSLPVILCVGIPGQAAGQEGAKVSVLEYEGWRQYSVQCARCHGQDVLPNPVAANLLVSVATRGPRNAGVRQDHDPGAGRSGIRLREGKGGEANSGRPPGGAAEGGVEGLTWAAEDHGRLAEPGRPSERERFALLRAVESALRFRDRLDREV